MAMNAGVWIDHKQAIVVLVTDAGPEIKKFHSEADTARRAAGAGTNKKYTKNDFVSEIRRERKAVEDRNQVFAEVLACLRGATAVLVLGPGEAKGEFSKYATQKKIRSILGELETADKMTDRQLVAKVKEHFASVPAAKPVTSSAKSVAPAKKSAAAGRKPATPVAKPATPVAKPATPVAKPATPKVRSIKATKATAGKPAKKAKK